MASRTVHGVEIAYFQTGAAGDPVVLIHGSLADHRSWDRVVPTLAETMEVVTYDRRGYGGSARVPSAHRVADDAADLAALLESINVYPVHVVAHSYAGAVALRLAISHPEMVRSLAIHEAPLLGLLADDPATASEGEALLSGAQELQRLIRAGETERATAELVSVFSTEPDAWGHLAAPVRAELERNLPPWAEEYSDPEALRPDRAACRELDVPVLLTVGSQSPRFLHRIARDLEGLLRNSRLLEIPDAGHSPHVARPHQYAGLLMTFLLERNVPVS